MKTINGPALFLAQFVGDEAPFNSWDSITKWAADCGYKGVQVPSPGMGGSSTSPRLRRAKDYCDEFKGQAAANGIEVTELSTHRSGPAWLPFTQLTTPFSTASQHPSGA